VKLRWQLILVSLLTLVLPWAGCQYVEELEMVLRKAEDNSLQARGQLIASRIAERNLSLYGSDQVDGQQSSPAFDLYSLTLESAPGLDGYADDWPMAPLPTPWQAGHAHADTRYLAGIRGEYLYLYLESPGPSEDMDVVLALEDGRDRLKRFHFAPGPPGLASPSRLEAAEAVEWRIQSNRQESANRTHIEARIPLDMVDGRFGFLIRSVAGDNLAGSISNAQMRPGLLIYGRADLQDLLERYRPAEQRVLLTDAGGWVLARAGEFATEAGAVDDTRSRMSINARAYRLALDRQYPAYPDNLQGMAARLSNAQLETVRQDSGTTHRYAMPGSDRLILSYALPLNRDGAFAGVLVIEQASDRVLTLADQALGRLVTLSLLASLLAAGGLLGYASYLSLRIGRLRNAAEQALQPGGGLRTGLPGVNKGDELGDLARSFQALLAELDDYTRYLKTLGDTLAHELRTPMTVVQSSLDNLQHENLPDSSLPFLRRAGEGVSRLQGILASLREAARIEQSVGQGGFEKLDLSELVPLLCNGYRDAFPNRRFEFFGTGTPCPVHGSPDLLAQMLDKLVENAVEFSPGQGLIHIRLEAIDTGWRLAVANEGPRLPAKARQRLFDSLVSLRGKRDGAPHLGLGLHIVKLIAENHGGRVSAGDSKNLSGAEFSVVLPAWQA
jgi:two-component system sensor histidine kinase ChvG